jgi:hypothetical protein
LSVKAQRGLRRQKYLAAFHGTRSKPRARLVEAAHSPITHDLQCPYLPMMPPRWTRSAGCGIAVHGGNMWDDCLCNGGFLGAGIYEPGVEASLANAALVLVVVGTLFQIPTSLILRGTRVYTHLDQEHSLFWIAVADGSFASCL